MGLFLASPVYNGWDGNALVQGERGLPDRASQRGNKTQCSIMINDRCERGGELAALQAGSAPRRSSSVRPFNTKHSPCTLKEMNH